MSLLVDTFATSASVAATFTWDAVNAVARPLVLGSYIDVAVRGGCDATADCGQFQGLSFASGAVATVSVATIFVALSGIRTCVAAVHIVLLLRCTLE